MLQKPLPLIVLIGVPEDVESSAPRVPLAKLFRVQERVAIRKLIRVPGVATAAKAPWAKHRGTRRKHVLKAVHSRLDDWCHRPEIKAGVFCSVSAFPLDEVEDDRRPCGKLIVRNHGDEFGEARGRTPLSCETGLVRDLRDLMAARLADWPGSVWLNRGPVPKGFGQVLTSWKPFPWIHLEFSTSLWQHTDGHFIAKRVREFSTRLEAMLTLWCRLQAW